MALRLWAILAVVSLSLPSCEAQFPRVCIHNVTRDDSTCCPIPPGSSEPCGGVGIGHCEAIPSGTLVLDHVPGDYVLHDARLDWPRRYFNNICVCEGRRTGYMCQQCQFGYTGHDCATKKPPVVRKNALTLSAQERDHVVKVFDTAKHTLSDYVSLEEGYGIDEKREPKFVNLSVYDFMVHIHYFSTKNVEVNGTAVCLDNPKIFSGETQVLDFGHNGPGFLTWHRLFLLWMEREMGLAAGDPDFTLPYWQWAGAGTQCPVCTDDLAGSTNISDPKYTLNSGSPFRQWETVCQFPVGSPCAVYMCNLSVPGGPVLRHQGGSPTYSSLPTVDDVIFTLSKKDYDLWPYDPRAPIDSFRVCLEGFGGPLGKYSDTRISTMHIQVHAFFQGHMSQVPVSPDDPLFFFHHCYIDKLFEVWFRKYNANVTMYPPQGSASPGHNLHDAMVPFFPIFKHVNFFKDSRELGYDYDSLEELSWGTAVKAASADDDSFQSNSKRPKPGPRLLIIIVVAIALFSTATAVIYTSSRWRPRTSRVEAEEKAGAESKVPLLSRKDYDEI